MQICATTSFTRRTRRARPVGLRGHPGPHAVRPGDLQGAGPRAGGAVPAWLQARALYDDPRAGAAASRLAELARPRLIYRPSPAVQGGGRPFAADLLSPIDRHVAGLSLDGVLPLREPPPRACPLGAAADPRSGAARRGPALLRDQEVYGTEHVPSLYKALAADGVLGSRGPESAPTSARRKGRGSSRQSRRRPSAGRFIPRVRLLRGRGSTARARPVPRRAPAQPRVRGRGELEESGRPGQSASSPSRQASAAAPTGRT